MTTTRDDDVLWLTPREVDQVQRLLAAEPKVLPGLADLISRYSVFGADDDEG